MCSCFLLLNLYEREFGFEFGRCIFASESLREAIAEKTKSTEREEESFPSCERVNGNELGERSSFVSVFIR